MKKIINVFLIVISFLMIINCFNVNKSLAMPTHATMEADGGKASTNTTKINPDDYDPGTLTDDSMTSLKSKVGVVLGAVRNISVVVAVISLMIIGVKYILGSVEEKANYKATLLPYVIGIILAVAGTTLVSFIYNSVK